MKKGRENDEEITILDSTGPAISGIICAKLIYVRTKKRQALTFKLFQLDTGVRYNAMTTSVSTFFALGSA